MGELGITAGSVRNGNKNRDEEYCHPERSERKSSNLSVVVIPSVARDLCDGEFHHLFIFDITEIPRFARNDGSESSESQLGELGIAVGRARNDSKKEECHGATIGIITMKTRIKIEISTISLSFVRVNFA